MATEIIEFPFDSGAYEVADLEWLPPNLLAVVENLRLDFDGRLSVRPGTTALGTTTYSAGAFTAYDLANFSGRLVALGSQTGAARPTDLFEYVNNKAVWRASGGPEDGFVTGTRLPRATAAREVGKIPDLASDCRYVAVTTGQSLVCAAYAMQNDTTRVHIFDPRTDQTIVLTTLTIHTPRVLYAGTDFWVVGQSNTNDDILGYHFDPSTDETLFSPVTLVALAARVNDLAAARTGTSDFTVAYATATNVEANRFNAAGSVQSTFTVTSGGTSIEAVACCGNDGGTRLSFSWQEGSSGAYFLVGTTQTGSGSVGPTALFGGAVCLASRRLGMTQEDDTDTFSIAGVRDATPTINTITQLCTNQTLNTLATSIQYADAFLQAGPVPITSDSATNFYSAVADNLALDAGTGTNQLFEHFTRFPQVYKDAALAGTGFKDENSIGSIGIIGTKIYWGSKNQSIAARNPDDIVPGGSSGSVTEMEMADTGRRQMAQVANQLHIAGAMPMVYDGRFLVEQGFAEKPAVSLAAGTAGSIPNGVFFVQSVWEVVDARGNILRSAASAPQTITLAGADDSITAISTTPHSLRCHPLLQDAGGISIRVGFYRTQAGGANFHIEQYVTVPISTLAGTQYGAPVTAVLAASDATLADNAVVYEQSQTPLSHVSPPPYQYVWPARERQVIGGLPIDEQWAFSKLAFPSEPMEFARSGRLGFSGRANQRITAVGAFETAGLVWTASEIGMIGGRGPEHSGTGDFDPFTLIPSPGGCSDWRSLVSTPLGFFFQMASDKLMLLTRGGEVQWIGQAVRSTLATYPVITGAVHIRSQMAVVFSCTTSNGSSGVLLVYDLRRGVWYVDTIGPVTSISEFQGRLALISSGVVSLQDTAAGSGTFVPSRVQTGYIAVRKRLGWGHIYKIGLLGEVLGACSVQALIDYDDGVGFRNLGTFALAGTEGTLERFWDLPVQKTARFSVRFVVTSASSNSAGVRLKGWAAEVQGSPNMVRVGSGGV